LNALLELAVSEGPALVDRSIEFDCITVLKFAGHGSDEDMIWLQDRKTDFCFDSKVRLLFSFQELGISSSDARGLACDACEQS
jgi:hypothetical protein